eukprot:CAMPEP_0113964774 /NCGR_PEP_ID=MMETSP0011_2-20120614/7348_1 /TAXON_ID=101924 /ORGANISM="Rhodosorus marinus" /LENGTH=404 /DNA_ID=CAMNT_0000977157 /DNA_START=143 /DNA_END=1357 /DNA_ORIENTATION=- /assembly_acc=CAM_ASM_000156
MIRSGVQLVRAARYGSGGIGKCGMATAALKHTVLYDAHKELQAKMAEFAGYEMPIQYPDGIKDSHLWVRASAGLFDVSHMGQIRLRGKDRVEFIEKLVTADVGNTPVGHANLSVFTTEKGTIIDDTIITNLGDEVGLVINAGCKDKDIEHIKEHLEVAKKNGMDVDLKVIDDHELLALQGPKAMEVLSGMVDAKELDLVKMNFMTAQAANVMGIPCHVTRCGYTGEDGFEISVPAENTKEFFAGMLADERVRPAGLGPRDSLRLEAGLCLYGSDIDDTTTPIEANINFVVAKSRRESGGFLGDKIILSQIADKTLTDRKRCGLVIAGAPARGGERVFDMDMNLIGTISSGTYSPTLLKPISMAYLKKPFNKAGTDVQVNVRGRMNRAKVEKMPFVEARYYRAPE